MSTTDQRASVIDDITGRVDGMYTLPELADILRVQPRTVRKYIRNGLIPGHLYSRAGGHPRGRLRFTAEQVREIVGMWAGVAPPADTPAPLRPNNGMTPYRPRRTGRSG